MTGSQIKALFAKQTKLSQSLSGIKTQAKYVRADVKAHAEEIRRINDRIFCLLIGVVFIAIFYGTFILGQTLTRLYAG